jgi:hypothetical protein
LLRHKKKNADALKLWLSIKNVRKSSHLIISVCVWFLFSTCIPYVNIVLCNNFSFVLPDMRNGGEKSPVPWRPDAGFSRYPCERRRQGLCERDDWLEQKIFGCERQVTSQPLNRTRVSLMPYLISVRNKNPQPYSVALREIDSSPCSVLTTWRQSIGAWKLKQNWDFLYIYIFINIFLLWLDSLETLESD